MKGAIAVLVAVAGFSVAAHGQLMKMLVSSDGVNFSDSVTASPHATIQVLVTASYTGTSTSVAGFGSANFQPTVSNWHATDALLAMRQGGNTLPADGSGMIQPQFYVGMTHGMGTQVRAAYVPGTYGRVNPMGRTYLGDPSQQLTGFVHVDPAGPGSGTFLRIAQANNPNWIGAAGNTTGGSGVNCAQLYVVGRTTSDPDFWGTVEVPQDPGDPFPPPRPEPMYYRRQNVELFRFAFTLDGSGAGRDMVVDAPVAGQQLDSQNNQVRYMGFYNNASNTGPGLHSPVVVQTGVVHVVPGPGVLMVMGVSGLVVGRRERRVRCVGGCVRA
jgi:hypothetical protein